MDSILEGNVLIFYDLDIFSVAVSVLIGILQRKRLKVDPDLWMNLIVEEKVKNMRDHLAHVVIDGGDEEAAHGGQGPGGRADEVCPVLAGGGVAGLGEAAADSEPLSAASISHPALGGALVTCKAGSWKNKMSGFQNVNFYLLHLQFHSKLCILCLKM